jgi:nucleoside-diphosphate-sugar epimerase
VVVHSAGLTKSRVLEEYYQVNLHNTERLVDALIELGMVPERFVFISSLASYGPGQAKYRLPKPIFKHLLLHMVKVNWLQNKCWQPRINSLL